MKKVLIIGAGFLQDFVIKKAKTMGYEVYAVDADPNAIGFKHADHYGVVNIVDEKACLEYARVNNVDGVLTAATDYGVLTAAYVAREMGLPGLKYEVAQLIKNKYQVRKCLYENHVDDTEQAYEVHEDTNIEELAQKIVYPVMVKPCDGSGSRGASRVDKADDLEEACKYAMDGSITHRAEIETFISGKEYGAETLVVNGKAHVLGIMQKWMTSPPYYAELGHAIPTDLKPEVEEKARNCVEKAIKALGVNFGSVNMDMLITEDGKVYIIDIGARMGGNMIGPCIIPYGTGVDYMAAMIQNAVGDSVDLRVKDKTAVATRLLAFDGGVVKMLPDMKEVEKKYDVEIYHHLEEGMKVNEYHTNLDGCGYIVAKANTQTNARKKTDSVMRLFEQELF
ncbi:ATP-grasp domain-containing protein [Firmicutes bacterium AM31-12AC]|nr:ATP-grasp domain-containing protein [Firmicutes bacterium AM43-11BH]RHT36393.1 ATP-grasp domain-containing protein [Firmicutes bacterium AM31-12AC]